MARTGRFGRQPRQAASLTNTLVAIAREYQNQRAQNIMDAWQKGGEFEGKKATDSVVLAFWKEKMKGVSKDDPLYDTYKNAHSQLDYTIHESKMTADYALKKVSDAQMVKFYLGWAKKVPKDSEFYRALQRDAGRYMRTVQTDNKAEAARRKEERYQRLQAETRKQKESGGEFLIDVLRRVAQSGYANGAIPSVIAAPGSGSDLTDFDSNDPDVMLRLIAAITGPHTVNATGNPGDGSPTWELPEGKMGGNTDVIYYDDDKKPVTGVDIMKQLAGKVPGWTPGTPLDINQITSILDTQMQGLNERIKRAKETGHLTDVSNLTKSKSYVALLNREVAAYPVQKAYNEARADYEAVIADPSSSPMALMKAWEEYSSTLTSLSSDPRIEANDNMRARLLAEVNGDEGVPSLAESFTGLQTGAYDPSSAKDIAENHANIQFIAAQIDAVAQSSMLPDNDPNKVVWTTGNRNSNGVFVPAAGGTEIGAATTTAIAQGGVMPQVVTVPDPLGGAPLTMTVTATPVYATAADPVTGDPLSVSNPNPIAYAYDIHKGGETIRRYGFDTKDGFRISDDPPFDPSLAPRGVTSDGQKRYEVDFSAVVATQLGYSGKDPVTGEWTTVPKGQKPGAVGEGIDLMGDPKNPSKPLTVVIRPQDLSQSTDTRNGIGQPDPTTDFNSLTLTLLIGDPEGQAILSNLDKNPAFKATMEADAYRSSGYQKDLAGVWQPTDSADPNKLERNLQPMKTAAVATSVADFLAEQRKQWRKDATGTPFLNDKKNTTGQTGPGFTAEGFAKLATDLVQGTIFESLGKVFQPGTTAIKPPEQVTGEVSIRSVGTIKAPALPEVKVTSTTSSGPTPASTATQQVQTQTQTGSTAPTSSQQTGSTAPSGGGSTTRKAY